MSILFYQFIILSGNIQFNLTINSNKETCFRVFTKVPWFITLNWHRENEQQLCRWTKFAPHIHLNEFVNQWLPIFFNVACFLARKKSYLVLRETLLKGLRKTWVVFLNLRLRIFVINYLTICNVILSPSFTLWIKVRY